MNFIEEKLQEKVSLEKFVLRFPPEPNGFLHLGHAKSICLNFGLAEKYSRPCNLRFDDTNPSTEETRYVDSIIEDVRWLGFTPTKIVFASDYFHFFWDCATDLISKGLAYVEDLTSEEIAELKGTPILPGKNSPCRSRSVKENMDLFHKMRDGEFPAGSKTLRAKIDMASPNMLLRDPILYRIVDAPHHRTGESWKIYPMYDFAHPLSDYFESVTDSLCTLEFEPHRPLYEWVISNAIRPFVHREELPVEGPFPEQTEFARLNLTSTVLSKRKLKLLVEGGYVEGWDDPRMPTLSGMRRRGYTPSSIKDFCEKISVTRRESIVSSSLLEECLRNDLNKRAVRRMGVMDPVKLTITNWEGGEETVLIENNPEDPESGKREITFSPNLYIEREDFREEANNKFHRLKLGGEVRLKGAYVIKAESVIKNEEGDIVEILCTHDPLSKSGLPYEKKIKGTIHWVSRDHCVNLPVREYENLFSVDSPEEEEDFLASLNPSSMKRVEKAVFEKSVLKLEIGENVQMIRKAYYVLDKDGAFNRTVSLKADRDF